MGGKKNFSTKSKWRYKNKKKDKRNGKEDKNDKKSRKNKKKDDGKNKNKDKKGGEKNKNKNKEGRSGKSSDLPPEFVYNQLWCFDLAMEQALEKCVEDKLIN